ncbi:MAG: CD1108 family mobile element protein, partial [Eubacterium sp.]
QKRASRKGGMMAGKATRLQFTEDELESPELRRAAEKADRADRAAEKRKKKRRPKSNMDQRSQRKVRLTFENETVPAGEIAGGGSRFRRTTGFVSGAVHGKIASENQDDNAAVEAVNTGTGMAEGGVLAVVHAAYSKKLKSYDKAEKLMDKSDSANVEALYRQQMAENPEQFSNPISRWQQKRAIRREYAAACRAEEHAAEAGSAAGKSTQTVRGIRQKLSELKDHAFEYAAEHPHVILIAGGLALLLLLVCSSMSSCSAFLPCGSGTVVATTFTARDEDIRGADEDYSSMEEALRERIREIKENNPDYDEYDLDMSEIGHNPYVLAAFLTVLYEDYSRAEVQRTLQDLFAAQYEYSTSHHKETVTETRQVRVGESLGQVVTSGYCNCPICCGIWSGGPTASGVYPTASHTIAVDAQNPFVPMGTKVVMNGVEYTVEDTGNFDRYGVQFDVYYDDHATAQRHGHQTWEAYVADDNGSNTVEVTQTVTKKILTVKVTNHSLESVIENWGLTDDQMERYRLLVQQKGNRDDLFADSMYVTPGGGIQYTIPGEALTDEKFAKMVHEAEKYLGYPYVWGGSSPSTSFDCSGFVSYVINHCGNGWNVGRQTAEGLRNSCSIIPASAAQPGDLIFFQGTYETAGASHVGIYVGNNMMIHCGNPIQYASIDTPYWRQHFYCFGRLPN